MVIYTTGRARVRLHAAEEGELCRSHIKTCRNVGKKEYCSLMSIKFNVETKNTDTAGSVELCSLLLHSLNLPELNQPKLFLLLQTCLIIQVVSSHKSSYTHVRNPLCRDIPQGSGSTSADTKLETWPTCKKTWMPNLTSGNIAVRQRWNMHLNCDLNVTYTAE